MNADLNEISNLLREKEQVETIINKMDEQKESIRKYCLSAVADVKENLSAIIGVLKKHQYLFPLNKYHEFSAYGNDGRECFTFKFCNDDIEIRTDVCYIGENGKVQTASACMGYFFCGIKSVDGQIAGLKDAKKPLEWWIDRQNAVDRSKKWIETVIRIAKEHISRIVAERRQKMNEGLAASAKEYVKISA